MKNNSFYITTAIPYVNGKPHIGHALEYFQADTIRNYHKLLGKETLLLSGADENALKNVQAAEKEGTDIQTFLDKNSQVFKESFEKFHVSLDVFQRGSDKEKHWPGVQELWNRCFEKGDIYKKSYTGLYCVGCESFKTPKELLSGKCPDHLTEPEKITEENYFFKLTNYQDILLKLIENDTLSVVPENKKNEIVSFIKNGLEDFSISRSIERAKGVGVPIPNDPSQVMYVWFDALAIYITGIGFGTDNNMFEKWWPADVHVIGKDINRFHTVYWPAMLMSAGLDIPKTVLIHGFITSGGQKMSKTLGNVINPFEISDKYGLEAFRYFLLSQIPTDGDGDFTEQRFLEVYNADLVNGLGNLVSRLAKLAENSGLELAIKKPNLTDIFTDEEKEGIEIFSFNSVLTNIWLTNYQEIDKHISKNSPWLIKDSQQLKQVLEEEINLLIQFVSKLIIFLPETSDKIISHFTQKKITAVKEPLFPRIS